MIRVTKTNTPLEQEVYTQITNTAFYKQLLVIISIHTEITLKNTTDARKYDSHKQNGSLQLTWQTSSVSTDGAFIYVPRIVFISTVHKYTRTSALLSSDPVSPALNRMPSMSDRKLEIGYVSSKGVVRSGTFNNVLKTYRHYLSQRGSNCNVCFLITVPKF